MQHLEDHEAYLAELRERQSHGGPGEVHVPSPATIRQRAAAIRRQNLEAYRNDADGPQLTGKAAAALLGVSISTLGRLVRDGKLPAKRLPGRRLVIQRADVQRLMEGQDDTHDH